ncbi:MAG: serine O-acetyltransferase [Bacillota bacterium]|nr:serine O-acetyltransferase [Bacillota bacterium]
MGKIINDMRAVRERDPACRSNFEVIFLYSGFHALVSYRLSHFFYKHKRYFIARLISQLTRFFTGIEIHPGARLGSGIFIDHGSGVVIGETTEMGDNCTIYQGVTLGGTGKDTGKRHPTLGNNVLVGSGAKILGPFRVGDHAKIAAGAVVLSEVPDYATAVGVPARVVRVGCEPLMRKGAAEDMDQIHVADPVALELYKLSRKIEEMQEKLDLLEQAEEQG